MNRLTEKHSARDTDPRRGRPLSLCSAVETWSLTPASLFTCKVFVMFIHRMADGHTCTLGCISKILLFFLSLTPKEKKVIFQIMKSCEFIYQYDLRVTPRLLRSGRLMCLLLSSKLYAHLSVEDIAIIMQKF